MLPTFVIGLREGLEAALIVGIIAAFLRKQGRRDLVRWVLLGVGIAVLLCTGIGVALDVVSQNLPQRQQEGLETVIGGLAVGMVTYMVVWMRRNSRGLKSQLEGLAADALGTTGRRVGLAMVLMAFLAVLREGIETVVFLLAAFDESASGASAPAGAVLGIVVAVALGYGIYRGGLRINLSKFFRATGIVLVLVAGGLVVNALHTAHEANWLNAGQSSTFDLTWLAKPGSVQSSLLTGMLGVQPRPVLIEVIGWLVYVVPVGLYVAWPPGRSAARTTLSRVLLAAGAVGAAAAVVLALAVTAGPNRSATTIAGGGGGPVARDARSATVEVTAAKGCTPDRTEFAAGGITFRVTNKDATGVTEVEVLSGNRIVGEKENLPPGFSGEFAANLGAGTYTLYCPGAATERTTLTVTGAASSTTGQGVAVLLEAGTTAYAAYVDAQVAGLATSAAKLASALRGTDLAAAQQAYIDARPFYEKIEPVAESFTVGTDSVDADIDARAGDVPAAQWRGFHRIEKGLFADKSLKGIAPFGTKLVADVGRLRALTAKLTYQPAELANGAQELLDEVAASKVTGEEERYSRIDMLDIDFNVEGSLQAFSQLQPALEKIDPALASTIAAHFDALDKVVDTYREPKDPSGFVRYTALTADDKRQIAAAVKAVQEPLSRVASKVAG